jgi:hypothetical protein
MAVIAAPQQKEACQGARFTVTLQKGMLNLTDPRLGVYGETVTVAPETARADLTAPKGAYDHLYRVNL